MRLDWLRPAFEADGPVAAVVLDVSRDDEAGAHEVELRWRELRSRLEEAGAPSGLVGELEGVVLSPHGRPGPTGRALVATERGVVLDQLLPTPPVRGTASYGAVPHLMGLVRGLADLVPAVVVEADRTGAEVVVTGPRGDAVDVHAVEGDHDELHKVGSGGWSHLRYQHRVEDSWERNADVVARDLDGVVRRHRPAVVVLSGDVRARTALREAASHRVADLVVDVRGGGRADGVDAEAHDRDVEAVLDAHRRHELADLVARFEEARGRGGAAVEGLGPVVEALRRGQVEAVLLRDDPTSTARLHFGPGPLDLAADPRSLRDAGVEHPAEERADALLLRALVATDAALHVVGSRFADDPLADDAAPPRSGEGDDDLPEEVRGDRHVREVVDALQDGVAALLRYVDPSTAT